MGQFNRFDDTGVPVKSAEYWARRAEWVEQKAMWDVDKINKKLVEGYDSMLKDVQHDISEFIGNNPKFYNMNAVVSHKEYLEKMDKLFVSLDKVKNQAVKPHQSVIDRINTDLQRTNLRLKRTRLEVLQEQIKARMTVQTATAQKTMMTGLTDTFLNTYDRKQFTISRGVGYATLNSTPDFVAIEKAILYPWAEDGSMFSDRLWNYVDKDNKTLVDGVRSAIVSDALGQGKKPIDIARGLTGFGNPALSRTQIRNNASRLLYTEASHIIGEANAQVSNDWGFTEYTYLATLDDLTSKVCQGLDGQTFTHKERQVGTNYPPMHPQCRSTTFDVIPDAIITDRASRDKFGKTVHEVPSNATYEQWKEFQKTGKKPWETKPKPIIKLWGGRAVTPKAPPTPTVEPPVAKGTPLQQAKDRFDTKVSELKTMQQSLDSKKADYDKYYTSFTDLPVGADRDQFREWKKNFDVNASFTEIRALMDEIPKVKQQVFDLKVGINTEILKTGKIPYDMAKASGVQNKTAEIIKSHKTFPIFSKAHMTEFSKITDNWSEGVHKLYSKMLPNIEQNQYNLRYTKKKGAHYSPSNRGVHMNINKNAWEQQVYGQGTKVGAWKTKFHEEFHQLDARLYEIGMDKTPNGASLGSSLRGFDQSFTSTQTRIGQTMIKAIDDDIIDFANKSISEYNLVNSTSLKTITDVAELGDRQLGKIYAEALNTKYPTVPDNAMIGMMTDATGLASKGQWNPHSHRFWGHGADYNRSLGRDGATSETWATFGSVKLGDDAVYKQMAWDYMPKTMTAMEEALLEAMEVLEAQDIKDVFGN